VQLRSPWPDQNQKVGGFDLIAAAAILEFSMKIRTLTVYIPLTWPADEGSIASAARFLSHARLRLSDAGFEVQSVCLATPPFLDVLGYPGHSLLLEFAHALDELAYTHNIDYVSIGPVMATTPLALLMSIETLPQLVAETERIYTGVLFADEFGGVNLAAAHALARAVHEIAHTTPSGLGNLRVGAMANVPPHIAYPHVAYHNGGEACFTIATEAADLAVSAIGNTRSISQAHVRLVDSIETTTDHILEVVDLLVDDHQIRFKGIDFSLTSFPDQTKSIGAAIESMGIESFGGSGTLFAMAFLTNAIRQTNIPHTGFSGVMLPVLQDDVLARRAAEGSFSLHDLLLYSAICSAGLDIIPIPGNTAVEEIGALYLDMAALAISVGRPVSARLMPIPGRAVGEKISFEAENLSTSRILPVKNLGVEKLFERDTYLTMNPLPPKQRTKSEIYPPLRSSNPAKLHY
jgi:uncharacterized protein (UPF0210 family)